MRALRIHEAAATEAAAAAAWYEKERPGLGSEFERAIDAALDLLEFPYSVIVREGANEMVVVAFAHHSRRPGYWLSRLRT